MITLADIELINTKVNQYPYKRDPERYFMPDFWERIDDEGGDCEDGALEKRHRLLLIGVPKKDLRIITAFVEPAAAPLKRDRYHAILGVEWQGVTKIADIRYPYLMDLDQLPYELHKIQIPCTPHFEWAKGADRSFA